MPYIESVCGYLWNAFKKQKTSEEQTNSIIATSTSRRTRFNRFHPETQKQRE
jgi:hypothetical protein